MVLLICNSRAGGERSCAARCNQPECWCGREGCEARRDGRPRLSSERSSLRGSGRIEFVSRLNQNQKPPSKLGGRVRDPSPPERWQCENETFRTYLRLESGASHGSAS